VSHDPIFEFEVKKRLCLSDGRRKGGLLVAEIEDVGSLAEVGAGPVADVVCGLSCDVDVPVVGGMETFPSLSGT